MSASVDRTVTSLTWSVLRPYMITCDGETVSLYSVNKEHALEPLKAQFLVSDERILNDSVSDMMIANGLTHEVILTGSRNGVLKVWDPKFSDHGHEINGATKLVTAAYLLSDQTRTVKEKRLENQTFYRYPVLFIQFTSVFQVGSTLWKSCVFWKCACLQSLGCLGRKELL